MAKKNSDRGLVSEPPPRPKKRKKAGKTLPKIPAPKLPGSQDLVPPLRASLTPPDSDPGTRSEESVAAVDELLEANSTFYRALTGGDAKAMAGIWEHRGDVVCVHPSGIVLNGWAEVGASWRKIFEGNPPKVIPESETVTVRSEIGLVFCVERIISADGMGLAGATNIFHRDEAGDWRMVWHHSALLPAVG